MRTRERGERARGLMALWRVTGPVAALLLAGVIVASAAVDQAQPKPQPPATQPTAGGDQPAPAGDDLDAKAAELQRQIEELVNKAQKSPATRPTAQPGRPGQPLTSAPSTQPAKGCGGGTGGEEVDINPPPPDQPQPRWVCEQPLIEAPPAWAGKPVEFTFKVRNEGEGVLNVKIKPG
jgi:hypothetical protein